MRAGSDTEMTSGLSGDTARIVAVGIGLAGMKRASTGLDSYFLAGNELPWYVLGMSNASAMWDITGTMWLVYNIFVYGMKGIWLPWLWPSEATAYEGLQETEFGVLPVGASGRRSVGFWGMAAVVTTEGAFFAYFLFSYFYLASMSANPWPATTPSPVSM